MGGQSPDLPQTWAAPGRTSRKGARESLSKPGCSNHYFNWLRLDDRITTSGQPGEAQLAALAALGVAHIVNLALHTHEKALPDEAASVAALAMTYTHIPVQFDNPTEADFARFCETMGQLAGARVHVHCIANYRVTAFFYRYFRDVLGMDEAQARAPMDQIWRPDAIWSAFLVR